MLAERHEGLVLERKTFSIGLHYRNRPELAGEITRALENIVSGLDNGYRLQHGKMIVELLPAAANKGDAIRTFMQHPPFSGRRPVFVGDDVTDEDVFRRNNPAVLGIRVGENPESAARYYLQGQGEMMALLQEMIACLNESGG
jgi:trehalose 6-phosphate phosphatase